MSGYKEALEAAGATVHAYEAFGSYQGDWLAHVTYNGITGLVRGSYGSCSYCDAFESEFDYDADKDPHYMTKLAAFGAQYLTDIQTPDKLYTEFAEQSSWDMDAQEVVDWIKNIYPPIVEFKGEGI